MITGGEIIVKHLVNEGVPYILGISGHGVMGLFDAIRREDQAGNIKFMQVKHEQAATSIADAYYRIKGEPLAVFASIGPGTLNTPIGLGTAYVDSTAFLLICGDAHVHMRGRGILQELDRYQDSNILQSLVPLAKRSWRAESVVQLPSIMRRAFDQMLEGRSGPVVVAVPMDVQAQGYEAPKFEPRPKKYSPAIDKTAIKEALAVMKTAKRPVILCGGGALYARVNEQVLELAEKWGAGIITTFNAKGAVSETHPQYCFHTGSKGTKIGLEITRNADVILALGTRFADETTCSYRKGVSFNFPDTKLIHVDIDPHEIGKNYRPNVGIIGDLRTFLTELLANEHDFEINKNYLQEITNQRKAWFDYIDEQRNEKELENKMTISKLIGIMNENLPEDTVIVTSSGNTQAQLLQEYSYCKPYNNLTTGGFSTMGWALPAGIGAKMAKPNAPVVVLVGDGDFMMTMQELATAAQYNIPIITIVADNSGWSAISDLQMDVFGKEGVFGNDFTKDGKPYSPDFVEIAKSFEMDAYHETTAQGIKNALQKAIANNKPALIKVDVCREYPNSGGEAFGWWDVPIPTYMKERRAEYEKGVEEEV